MAVKIYGHRGALAEKPENTIEGFLRARSAGVAGVETDIVLTKDMVPVLHHDLRLPDGRTVADVDARDLPADVPTLPEAIKAASDIEWLLEIKRPLCAEGRALRPDHIADCVLSHLAGADRARIEIWSFDWPVLEAFGRRAPDLRRGCFTGSRTDIEANCEVHLEKVFRPEDISRGLADAGVTRRGAFHAMWTQAEINAAREAGLGVVACFVNDESDFARLEYLVDGVITDWPSRFARRGRKG